MTGRVLVALHGHGDDPSTFSAAVAPLAETTDRALVVPSGPVHSSAGRAWFPSLADDEGPGLAPTLDRLDETISAVEDPAEVVLLGWSQGAATALAAVLRAGAGIRPRLVVALAAWLPNEPDVTWDLAAAHSTRFLLVHGVDDPVVPVEQGRSVARVLERAGLDVSLVEVAAAHDLPSLLDAARPGDIW
jgi:predicted esterase